ncbi:hypothetical protein CPLU01_03822 [Colletotrichum plurivorum]|uniref:Uncharacterized protein n=1 Tax=Colletotrichum plurivorum TaxID=2175906 RepID=A0A8H6KS74_9PEZI|nr:hypothetical protein CPLU01_03822 [Colletotrichum plurivorum]
MGPGSTIPSASSPLEPYRTYYGQLNTPAEYHQGFTNMEPTVSHVSLSNWPYCPGFEAELASPVPAHLDAQA